MADGYITIETKLSTNKFDRQVTELENKIRNEEDKAQLKLKAKLQAEDELARHKQAIFEIEKEYERTSQQVEHLQNIMSKQTKGVSLTPQDFTDLQNYAEINKQNEKLDATLDRAYEKQTKLNNKVEQTSLAYKQIQDNVQGYKTKIESVKLQKQQAQVDNIKKNFEGVSKSVGRAIRRVASLALSIISVASAYSLVSSASSTLGQYDEQYASNLEYIRYLLAQALAPALRYLVSLASTLLGYLNYILNAWFGITLFSKNSAKNFVSAKNSTGRISKNTGKISKNTEKIKKDLQTTSFDEMNVLSDTSDTGTSGTSGGGGSTGSTGGTIMPSIDPTAVEIPEWLKKITEFLKPVIDFFKQIIEKYGPVKGAILIVIGALAGFFIIKSLIKLFTGFGKSVGGISADFTGFLDNLRKSSQSNSNFRRNCTSFRSNFRFNKVICRKWIKFNRSCWIISNSIRVYKSSVHSNVFGIKIYGLDRGCRCSRHIRRNGTSIESSNKIVGSI